MALTVTAVPEVSPAGVPRVRLAISGVTGPQVYAYRRDPDGRTVTVRQASPALLTGSAVTVYDYEAPFDVAVSYTVSASGDQAASGAVTSTSDGTPWLIHPGMPERSAPLRVLEWPTWTRPTARGVFSPIGRRNRVAVATRRQSREGTLSLYTASASSRDALETVLEDGVALLLSGTATDNAGVCWVSVGDVTETPVDVDLRTFSIWSLPIVEVEAPTGAALPPVTYADAAVTFFDYGGMASQVPDYGALAAGGWKE